MSGGRVKRRYDASSRQAAAERTRERICAAAEDLFLRDGYARTTMRAVATAAGVAEATVYLSHPGKPALLDAVILRAVRDNPSERLETIAAAPAKEILPRFARSNAVLMARAGRLIALGEAAAQMDAELRPLRDAAHERLHAAFLVVARRLDEADMLRVSVLQAADTLFAIANENTYLRMTERAKLSNDEYADWLTDTLGAVLLRRA
jgi:AcrR family transcriptional regulator